MRKLLLEAIVTTDEEWKGAFHTLGQASQALINHVTAINLTAENLPNATLSEENLVVTDETAYKALLGMSDVGIAMDDQTAKKMFIALENHGIVIRERA